MKLSIPNTVFCTLFIGIAISLSSYAQQESFYATLSLDDAKALQKELPESIEFLNTTDLEAAVLMTEEAGHALHKRILVHGPGYIRKPSAEKAIADITTKPIGESLQKDNTNTYTITQDDLVTQALNEVDAQEIETHILELQAYGTRNHTQPQGVQAAQDLKTKWESLAATYNRNDVSVRLFNHSATSMPSVIMTIEGTDFPNEYVITGGHLDTTSSNTANAPGADDDASGIATITEAARVLFELDFRPKRTIEIMAYAAEEIGLVGSAEIAQTYNTNNKNVVGVTQFDMTNFNGSTNDVYFINDNTDATLNSFMMSLLDHYNGSGTHAITYSVSACNYGCSDHASWHAEGFPASFPFEASFSDANPNIHTANDIFAVSGSANHATKFAKLCTEYLIEVAKSDNALSVGENLENVVSILSLIHI